MVVVSLLLSLSLSLSRPLHGHMAETSEAHPSRTATKNLSRVMPSPSLAPSKETVNVERRRGGADRLTEIGRASDTPFLIHPTFPRILDAAHPHLKLGYNLGIGSICQSIKIYLRERHRAHLHHSALRSFSARPNNGGLVFAGNRKLPGDHIRQEVPRRRMAVPVPHNLGWDAAAER